MKHKIGYVSEFDNCMSIVEKFVYHSKNPNLWKANECLYDYYIYNCKIHYNFVKDVLLEKNGQKYLQPFEDIYKKLLQSVIIDYENKIKIDMIKISTIFFVLSSYACMTPEEPENLIQNIYDEILDYPVYYIVTDDAFYGINTFLYAFFEGVFLAGIPTFETLKVDGYDLCPLEMFIHDTLHIQTQINAQLFQNDKIKNMYYKILNDDVNQHIKEFLLSVLFVYLHEINVFDIHKINEYMLREIRHPYTNLTLAHEIMWKYYTIADEIPDEFADGLKEYFKKFDSKKLNEYLREPTSKAYGNINTSEYIKCSSILYYALNLIKNKYC